MLALRSFFSSKQPTLTQFERLEQAIRDDDIESLELILREEFLFRKEPLDVQKVQPNGMTLFQFAVSINKYTAAEWLLIHGSTVKEYNANGLTALQLMLWRSKYEAAEWLLAHGSTVGEYDDDGWTALQLMLWESKYEAAEWLLAHGSTGGEHDADGLTALQLMLWRGKYEAAEWLLAHGSTVGEYSDDGWTALQLMLWDGKYETAEWLSAHGSTGGEYNVDGLTALPLMLRKGKYEAAEWLLERHASVDEKSTDGLTTLELAIIEDNIDAVRWLLDHHVTIAKEITSSSPAILALLNSARAPKETSVELKENDNAASSILIDNHSSSATGTDDVIATESLIKQQAELEANIKQLQTLTQMSQRRLQKLQEKINKNKTTLRQQTQIVIQQRQYQQQYQQQLQVLQNHQSQLSKDNQEWEASNKTLSIAHQALVHDLEVFAAKKTAMEEQLKHLSTELSQICEQLQTVSLTSTEIESLKQREKNLATEKANVEIEKMKLTEQQNKLWQQQKQYEQNKKQLQQKFKELAWREKFLAEKNERLKLIEEKYTSKGTQVKKAQSRLENARRQRERWMNEELVAEEALQNEFAQLEVLEKTHPIIESLSNKQTSREAQAGSNMNIADTPEAIELTLYKIGIEKIGEAIEDAVILAEDLSESAHKNQFLVFIDNYKKTYQTLQQKISKAQPKKIFLEDIKKAATDFHKTLQQKLRSLSSSTQSDLEVIMLTPVLEEVVNVFAFVAPKSTLKLPVNNDPPEILQTKKWVMQACFEATARKLALIFKQRPSIFLSYSWTNSVMVQLVRRIAEDLKRSGPYIFIDVWQNTLVTGIPVFIEKIANEKEVNGIMLMGSPDLVEKYLDADNVVKLEQDLIFARYKNNTSCVIPVLISGKPHEAFPGFLGGGITRVFTGFSAQDIYDVSEEEHYYESLCRIISRLADMAFPGDRFADQRGQVQLLLKDLLEKLQFIKANRFSSEALMQLYMKYQQAMQVQIDNLSRQIIEDSNAFIPNAAEFNYATIDASLQRCNSFASEHNNTNNNNASSLSSSQTAAIIPQNVTADQSDDVQEKTGFEVNPKFK